MKRLYLFLTALWAALWIQAAPVDQRQALETAQAYINTQPTAAANGPRRLKMAYESKSELTTADTRSANYYVFNVNEGDGFVIVSGDDRTVSILGSSSSGTFDADHMPENLRWWLSCYDAQMEWVKANVPEKAEVSGRAPARSSSEVIPSMMTTRWDQGSPYNFHCPTVDGATAPTGCLATALAQIMNYHKWPQSATRSLPQYNYPDYSRTIPGLSPIVFDWDHMLDSYTPNMVKDGIATPEVEAVSQLMRYAGQIVQMVYGSDGSGTNKDYLIPNNIAYYFGYASTCWGAQRSDYSIGEWEDLILNELRNKRPVLYCGYTSSWEGHAFVCDGYNGDGRFNINWGWGGYADGPYRLSVLDASYSGIGGSQTSNQFSVGQVAYFGIQPTGTDTEDHNNENLTVTERPSVYQRVLTRAGSNMNFNVIMHMPQMNNTGGSYSLSFGYDLYRNGEQVKRLMQARYNLSQFVTYLVDTQEKTVTLNFGAGLADGDYEIYAVSQNKNSKLWEKDKGSDRNYLKAHIEGNTLTLTPMPEGEFTINDVTQTKNAVVVNFTNTGAEYNGPFYLLDSNMETVSWENIAVEAGETTDVAFYIPADSPFSTYQAYYLSTDYFQNNWFYTNAHLEDSDLVKTMKILNMSDDGTTVYGSKLLCQIDVTNRGTGLYQHAINTELRNPASSSTSTIEQSFYQVPAGESIQLYYEVPITKTQRGKEYEIVSTHTKADGTLKEDKLTFIAKNGATWWDGNGQVSTEAQQATYAVAEGAAAADVATAYTKDVTANGNPNTMYLLDTTVPNGLKGKNVVSSKLTTGNIHLYDGYEYYIPTTFNTTVTANYHRTINQADSWSTIALPFAPTAVTADGTLIDWKKSSSDTGKSLYIMALTDVQGDNLIFDYTEEMAANTPYIIAVGPELVGKELIFTANGKSTLKATRNNIITIESNGYSLTGVNTASTINGAYLINGLTATPANGAIEPFRAYLNATGGISYSQMNIVTDIILSGIRDIMVTTPHDGMIYNLKGQKTGTVRQAHSLPKGIYIINGKKVVVK